MFNTLLLVHRESSINLILQRKTPVLISWLVSKAWRRLANFCWTDLPGGHGAVTGQPRWVFLVFVFPSLWCWFLDICLRSLLNPAVSRVRSQPLRAGLCPLGTVPCSHLPKSLAISWVGKQVEGGRERKQKHFTCCLPKDRSLILP